MSLDGLLERDGEIATASAVIEAVGEGDGQLLLVEGAAGIGKTRLLRTIRDLARGRGACTVAARGSELERESPFNVVRSLLEPLVARATAPEREALLSGAALAAAKLLDPAARRPADADEAFNLLHGLTWLTINLSQRGPLVLLVDDAHWLDSPSARFLAYLADRLEDGPILLAVALRPDEPGVPRAVARLAAHRDATILRPAPLSAQAVAVLAGEALSAPPTAAFAAALHAATLGSPFGVRSLLVDLAADGIRPDDRAVAVLRERVPVDFGRALALRLEGLPDAATRLAGAVAVLGDGSALNTAARLGDLDADEATEMRDLLVRVDVLAPGRELSFTHPLARSAIYQRLSGGLRSQLHAQAARMLSGTETPDRLAPHLLEVEPAGDPSVVDTLHAAARGARSLGGHGAAIAYLRRALAEPPAPDQRFGTLAALGMAEVQAWDNAAGIDHLREAVDLAPDPIRRAEIAMMLAGAHRGASDFIGAVKVLTDERAKLADAAPEMARVLESGLLQNAVQDASAHAALDGYPRPDPARLSGATRGERRLLMVLALEALVSGEPRDRGLALARRALAGAPPVRDEPAGSTIVLFPIVGLIEAGAQVEIAPLLDWLVADARRQGSLVGYVSSAAFRGHARWLSGDLDGAEADAISTWSQLRETPGVLNAAQALGVLLNVLVARGDLAGADTELAESGLADAPTDQINLLVLAAARLRLRLAQRRWNEALAESDRLDAACAALGVGISGTMERAPNRALVLLGLGRRADALRTATAQLEAARRYGAAHALSAALRALGLIVGGDEGAARLASAARTAEAAGANLHLASALLDHGAALRRLGRKREAREPLRRALDVAGRIGAHATAANAHAELLASGARPRRAALSGAASLTARERRVARLAADGLSNPEIAQALFITRKTVEKHVGEVLRKLQLDSRQGIAAALESAPASLEDRAPLATTS